MKSNKHCGGKQKKKIKVMNHPTWNNHRIITGEGWVGWFYSYSAVTLCYVVVQSMYGCLSLRWGFLVQ